ncbi:MAG: 30S ribosomal protein S14 [Gammaproteobacteria bacterium]|nr:30S ribosomal protein S14 [Gammaproteobacteria bacterium]MDD9798957.1 30S ribosomal protein S14 [Gammaproteobacteria bacterium]MDD9815941.1 30S ribosomal protein S14 [Gammaproteobacteria bacterium]MDD9850709.1 30S ribosomal protein S14 [Gammaproteobacteria bacterium]MDD9870793.1 30S ribosomal protein S14 [Gammaproteobacteria bacterium]
MAKKSMIAREKKRRRLAARYRTKRAALLLQMKAVGEGEDEHVRAAMLQLQQLPRDSSRSRQRNRCQASGRPRGYYRKFGLARNKLREVIMRGEAPGVVKASW